MKIALIVIGKTDAGYFVEAINEYLSKAFENISIYDTVGNKAVQFTIRLTEDEYTGVIDVPKEPEGYQTTVVLQGWHGEKQKAKLTVVSSTSIVEGGSHDVVLKNATPNIING